jgi:hypothetical protein
MDLPVSWGLFVGSVIVTDWQYQDKADTDSSKEADAVGDLYQMAPNLEEREITTARLCQEWPLMRKTIKPNSGWSYLFEIRSTPPSTKNSILLNNMEKKLRQRIQSSLSTTFPLSSILIFFNMFLGLPYWLHVTFLSCLSIPISLCIVVIIALSPLSNTNPY